MMNERKKSKGSFSKKRLTMKIIQSRPSLIKNDIVIKSFENSNCTLEKDWIEWYRKVNKSILEQNPSKFIYIYYIITEYYFNMTLDLNLHSFLSVFNNNTDNNRGIIIGNLEKALLNPNTPDYIIISILNLIDFSEKKKTIISFMKHEELGKIAYNCKDYAKALYFKEKGFEDDSNLESIDDFIDLYYKLNVTENGKGIIQFIENNPTYEEIKLYNKKYIWYINLHDYNKALQIINEKLSKAKEKKNIKVLKNYRNICLYGLCDWETILTEEENEQLDDDNILKINIEANKDSEFLIDEKAENEEKLERKLLLLKSCLALGKWDKFYVYMKEIKEIFMKNIEKEYSDSNCDSDINNQNQNDDMLNESDNKNHDDKIEEYISFNDLINKNEFQLLKYDESIFDLNICAIIENLKKNNIDIARKYINSCQRLLINKLKILIKETNTRGNDALFKNQCLQQLEKYCNYKQYHYGDKQYLEQLKSKLKLLKINLNQNPDSYIQYIAISSLINPIEEEYHRYIDLSKYYIKSEQFTQAENILNILKKKLNIKDNYLEDKNLIFDEKRIKMELCYNKCLFAKGKIDKAVSNLKDIIVLLNDNNLSDYNKLRNIIKSKIYGNYAIYKIKQLLQKNSGNRIKRQKSENINGIFSRHISNYLNEYNFESFVPKKEDSDKEKKVRFNIDEKMRKSVKEKNDKGRKNNPYNIDFLNDKEIIDSINHYLTLATEFNSKSYKYWHNYGVFNYRCYKLIYIYKNPKNEYNKKYMTLVFEFAINAINGLKNSLLISNKSKVRTLDDCLRFIDIFFELGDQNKNILSLIESIINEINLEIFIGVIPQLTCRFDVKDQKVLDILIKLLSKLLSNYPEILLFPLISIQNSNIKESKEIACLIIQNAIKQNNSLKELSIEYEEFIKELNRCSVLYHEEWLETIEASAKLYLNKDYNNMINLLIKMHKKMNKTHESLYEINFYQLYGSQLKEAERKINKLLIKQNLNYLKEAWEIYQTIYESINEKFTNFQTISLQYISPKLFNFKESNIIVPGFLESYIYNTGENNFSSKSKEEIKNYIPVTINKIDKYLYIIESKERPRKITMIGTNNKQYIYLLKGLEDLRQGERVMQIFNLVNLIFAKKNRASNINLFITVYAVIPLSDRSGLIGWIHDCNSLDRLIKEYRKIMNKIPRVERNILAKYNPGFESSTFLKKVDSFLYVLSETKDLDLRQIIWLKSKDSESWFIRTTNYSRSLAVMSIVGYILGLGDRRLNNLIMNRKTGKIVHINFSDCFEVAMKREKYPEKVPFRLTRMLVRALGITGVEGMFRLTCEKTLMFLKDNRDSLLSILSALVHNPLVSFKLLIPLIIEQQKEKFNIKNNDINIVEKKSENTDDNLLFDTNLKNNNIRKISEKRIEKRKYKNKEEIIEIKDERHMMEKEHDDYTSELYKIAQIVLQRIDNKLNGMDFYSGVKLNEKEQVDILIKEAMSPENLATSYLGWEPFL